MWGALFYFYLLFLPSLLFRSLRGTDETASRGKNFSYNERGIFQGVFLSKGYMKFFRNCSLILQKNRATRLAADVQNRGGAEWKSAAAAFECPQRTERGRTRRARKTKEQNQAPSQEILHLLPISFWEQSAIQLDRQLLQRGKLHTHPISPECRFLRGLVN